MIQLDLKPHVSILFVKDEAEDVIEIATLTIEVVLRQTWITQAVLLIHVLDSTPAQCDVLTSGFACEVEQLVLEDVVDLQFEFIARAVHSIDGILAIERREALVQQDEVSDPLSDLLHEVRSVLPELPFRNPLQVLFFDDHAEVAESDLHLTSKYHPHLLFPQSMHVTHPPT